MSDPKFGPGEGPSLETALGVLEGWEGIGSTPEGFAVVVHLIESLPLEERAKWFRGKRVRFRELQARFLEGQEHPVSRGNAYELIRMVDVAAALEAAREVGPGYRDSVTNRRVKTVIRELARLNLRLPEDQEWLVSTYRKMARGDGDGGPWTLAQVKGAIRRAQS